MVNKLERNSVQTRTGNMLPSIAERQFGGVHTARLTTFDIGADVDFVWEFRDVNFKSVLDIIENLCV